MDLHTNIPIKGGDHMFKQLISRVPFNRFFSVKAGKVSFCKERAAVAVQSTLNVRR